MSEIKFRGKCKDNGKLIHGWYAEYKGKPVIYSKTDKPWIPHKVIPETVGESTGRTDKNGMEIFAGDLVKSGNSPLWEVRYQKEFCRYILFLDSEEDGPSYVLFGSDLELEIIGNIHNE